MGKKKDKARRKHAERHAGGKGEIRFDIPPQVAGIAAVALKQVDTPAFKQLIAGALGAAARSFDQRRAERRPDAPPPAPPEPARPVAQDYRPRFETPDLKLSPEAARAMDHAATQATKAVESAAALATHAIEGVAAALDRWAKQTAADHHAGQPPFPPSSHPAD